MSVENRQILIDALNNLPDKYQWDFTKILEEHDCDSIGCAYGLMMKLWPNLFIYHMGDEDISHFLSIPHDEVEDIFDRGRCYGNIPRENITSKMVADRLVELGKEIDV